MAHIRKVVRHKIIELLTGNTVAEDRVYNARLMPLDECDFPAIRVYTLENKTDEDKEECTGEEEKKVFVIVELSVAANETYADDIDDFEEQVENLLGRNLAGEVENFKHIESEILIAHESSREIAVSTVTFKAVKTVFS